MTASRIVRSVRVHVPVEAETLRALLAGEASALERDPTLRAMLAIIREQGALGDFGLYHGVAEITLGWETFVPGPEATPTLGNAAETTYSPTVTLTTWIREGADQADVDAALDALMAAHPWEIPVIEVAESRLLLRR
ncbi:hypothetical protein [Novosphingobium huizhouense]|uniref:hypothetical protein n=1 Tax=Novosphingobium huizhouense TaxID=2866625 RepID=UPI001CD881DF|nr:hypothetical protein [Novosphingobium huizhouense]